MAEVTTDDVPEEWAHTAKLAREGDTEAARDILREVADRADLSSNASTVSIPRACAQYLAEAFRQILDHDADASRALGLKERKAGRPPGSGKTHNQVRLGAVYWLLRRRGLRPEEAKEKIWQATGADRTTVEDAANACSALEEPTLIGDDILLAIISAQPGLSNIVPPASPAP